MTAKELIGTTITPIEFIEHNCGECWRNGELVVWYHGFIVDHITYANPQTTGLVALHHPIDPCNDYTRIANVGKYETCLQVELYDLTWFRDQLSETIDRIPDEELLDTLQEMRQRYG